MEDRIDLGVLVDWVNDADDATIDSRENAEKCRDYYDSKQISTSEAAALKKRKQAPVVINRIKPKVDGLAGMERQNRTTARAFPRTPQHEQDANAATEAIRFVLQDNFYQEVRSSAWDNLCIEGTGGIEVMVKEYGKDFKIIINHIPWDRIIYDPYSRKKDFSDARFLGQVIWLDYDQALARFPEGADVLETMIEGSSTYEDKPNWLDSRRRRVKIVEMYYLDGEDYYYACFTRGGFLKPQKKSPYVDEEGESECPYDFASLFVDRDGQRYGSVMQYLDVQDEINKRRSKALHLMSVRQVMFERGAVEDINKARAELARPDGVVEVTPGMVFEVLKTGDMAAAQFNLLTEAKQEIDAVGYNAAVSGKESKSMSGVALESRRLAGQTEIAPMFDVLKHLDIRVYRKIWNRIKQYWKEEKWIRVTDDMSNIRFVPLNYKNPQTGQMQNNVAELDVDIIIDDAPDSVTMQQEEFVAMSEMVKSGIPIPPTAIIEASNLKNKHKILQQMQQSQVNPEAVKKMQEEMQKMAAENQQLKADQQVEMQKLQVQSQLDAQELQQKMEIQRAELQLEREKAQAEIQLMYAKADAEIKLKHAECEADMKMKAFEVSSDQNLKEKEFEFEQQQESKKQKEELKRKAEKEDAPILVSVMPKVMDSLERMHKTFHESSTKFHESANKPKKKKIRLQRTNGQISGAEVDES